MEPRESSATEHHLTRGEVVLGCRETETLDDCMKQAVFKASICICLWSVLVVPSWSIRCLAGISSLMEGPLRNYHVATQQQNQSAGGDQRSQNSQRNVRAVFEHLHLRGSRAAGELLLRL